MGAARITLSGYRKNIDEYFHNLMADRSQPSPLEQKMPSLCREVLEVMAQQKKPGHRRMASYLLGYGDEGRNRLWEMLTNGLSKQRETGRVFPVTSSGDPNITVFCWEMGRIERDGTFARRHALAAMCAAGKRECGLLEVTFGSEGRVAEVDWSFLELDSLDLQERADMEESGRTLVQKRLQAARESRRKKIGRNERCPCGSGKKYKKCHGR